MFERFTEKARRVIFFARYEASQYGSPTIESEHLLLGLLREDALLTRRLLKGPANIESLRNEIEAHTTRGERISTSVDMPLSVESRRALQHAAEEAERLACKHVGTEHLLLGLLDEKDCMAARILMARGVDAAKLRIEIGDAMAKPPALAHAVAPKELRVARISSVLKRWAAGQAKDFAEQFHPEGQYADIRGTVANGRGEIEALTAALFRSPHWNEKRWHIKDVQLVENLAVVTVFSGEQAGPEPLPGEMRLILLFKQFSEGWLLLRAEAAVASALPSEGST